MNAYVLRNRERKAAKLASVMVAIAQGTGVDPSEIARSYGPAQQEQVRVIADKQDRLDGGNGVHRASNGVDAVSPECWAETIRQLVAAEATAGALAGVR